MRAALRRLDRQRSQKLQPGDPRLTGVAGLLEKPAKASCSVWLQRSVTSSDEGHRQGACAALCVLGGVLVVQLLMKVNMGSGAGNRKRMPFAGYSLEFAPPTRCFWDWQLVFPRSALPKAPKWPVFRRERAAAIRTLRLAVRACPVPHSGSYSALAPSVPERLGTDRRLPASLPVRVHALVVSVKAAANSQAQADAVSPAECAGRRAALLLAQADAAGGRVSGRCEQAQFCPGLCNERARSLLFSDAETLQRFHRPGFLLEHPGLGLPSVWSLSLATGAGALRPYITSPVLCPPASGLAKLSRSRRLRMITLPRLCID